MILFCNDLVGQQPGSEKPVALPHAPGAKSSGSSSTAAATTDGTAFARARLEASAPPQRWLPPAHDHAPLSARGPARSSPMAATSMGLPLSARATGNARRTWATEAGGLSPSPSFEDLWPQARLGQTTRYRRGASPRGFLPPVGAVPAQPAATGELDVGAFQATGARRQVPGHQTAYGCTGSSRSSPTRNLGCPAPYPIEGMLGHTWFSGHVAAIDSTSLPKIYSVICKDDVQRASARLDEAMRVTAARRRDCDAEVRQQCRRRAALWGRREVRRQRRRRRAEEAAASAAAAFLSANKHAPKPCSPPGKGAPRWQRAIDRIAERKAALERVPEQTGDDEEEQSDSQDEEWQPDSASQGSSNEGEGESSQQLKPRAEKLQRESTVHRLIALKGPGHDRSVSLDAHLHLLRKMRKLRHRALKAVQSQEARKERYEKLPQKLRDACEMAYSHFVTNQRVRPPRIVGVTYLRACLHDVGLRGLTVQEEVALLHTCKEAVRVAAQQQAVLEAANDGNGTGQAGVDIYVFGTAIVPKVQRVLASIRHRELEEAFRRRDEGTGKISMGDCEEIIKVNLELQIEPDDIAGSLEDVIQDKDKVENNDGYELNLHQLERLVSLASIQAERRRCARERHIQELHDIERDTYLRIKPDVLRLHQLYKRHATGVPPRLPDKSCDKFFKELGLYGSTSGYHISGRDSIDFMGMLDLVEQIRCEVECQAFDFLQQSAFEYSRGSMRIAAEEVQNFLALARTNRAHGVNMVVQGPNSSRAESKRAPVVALASTPALDEAPDVIAHALLEALVGSRTEDGLLTWPEIRRALQRAREQTCRARRQIEVAVAIQNGFRESDLEELHNAFTRLDSDGSGLLDMEEAWEATNCLDLKMTRLAFKAAFSRVDEDDSGELDFFEFLVLLRLMRDREDVFAENRDVSVLGSLNRKELLHLLTYFNISFEGQEEAKVSDSALLRQVCDCFAVSPEAQVHVGGTFQDLCLAAMKLTTNSSRRSVRAWTSTRTNADLVVP